MAAAVENRPVEQEQAATIEQPSLLDELKDKVSKFILTRWTLVIASALLAAACFGVYAGLGVGFVTAVLAWVTREKAPAPQPTPQLVVPARAPMNIRERNIQIFEETLREIQNGQRINPLNHQWMLDNTRVVHPFAAPIARDAGRTQVILEPITTFAMTRKLVEMGHRPLVLDMANAYVPGGAVRTGANAQEETLCRQTNLYPALERMPYPLPEKGGLWVPDVQFFRDDAYNFVAPFRAAVFVSAAYDCNPQHGQRDRPESMRDYETGTKEKMRTMFRAGVHNHNRALVLSAFGCGAFRNDPAFIANWYKQVLNEDEFIGAFEIVAFGIYDLQGDRGANFLAFRNTFNAP